jgi:hypothetical protein
MFWHDSGLWETQFWSSSKWSVWILLWDSQGRTSSNRFVRALLSWTFNSQAVRMDLSEFCSPGQSRLNQVWTVSSGLCSLRHLIPKQFELICLNSALWDSQGRTSSNRFVRDLLSWTFNSETVRIDLSEFCSLRQSRLNQFETFVRALISDRFNSEAVRIDLSEFCSLEQSRLNQVWTVSSEICSLIHLILKQFELICLNSALWDSQGWTSSNRSSGMSALSLNNDTSLSNHNPLASKENKRFGRTQVKTRRRRSESAFMSL